MTVKKRPLQLPPFEAPIQVTVDSILPTLKGLTPLQHACREAHWLTVAETHAMLQENDPHRAAVFVLERADIEIAATEQFNDL